MANLWRRVRGRIEKGHRRCLSVSTLLLLPFYLNFSTIVARKNVISLQQILLITLLNYHRRSHSSLEEEVTNIFLLLKGSYFYAEKGPTELSPFNEGGELQIHYHFILLSVLQQEKKGKGKRTSVPVNCHSWHCLFSPLEDTRKIILLGRPAEW